ncbi:MAG: SAM-dependent methyltransferase, partial [Chloroflexota bacterium]
MTLRERLGARIRARGPMSFADYMAAALYDPDDGYYSTRVALGFEGDYLTSPDLGPHFGRSLARAFGDCWAALGKPAAWDLVEAGAGRGTLLREVLTSLERERQDAARGVRPAIVEVSPRLRAEQSSALEGRDIRWASDPRALAPLQGVVYANEILDAFPVHILARTAEGIREVFVDEKDGRLFEALRAPSPADLGYRVPEALPVGGRWEVSPEAEGWVAGL